MQHYLELEPLDVAIPYAQKLAQLIPPVAVRLRRDFPTLLALIEAHALLHQHNRERDENGTIVANLCDYKIVRELVDDLLTQEAGVGAPDIVRETRQAIEALSASGLREITVKQVARALSLDISAAWRRVQLAIEHDVVRNLQTRPRQPARLVPWDNMQDAGNLLPTVDQLAAALSVEPNCRNVNI